MAEFAQSAAEIVYSDAVFIIDLLGIPPAVEIKIGSYAGSRFTHGIGALEGMAANKKLAKQEATRSMLAPIKGENGTKVKFEGENTTN